MLTKDTWLPTEEELTVEEVPLGTPFLKAAAHHTGKYCETVNNEFILCRTEEADPRKCLKEGRAVTSCHLDFFKKMKLSCNSELTQYAACLEKSSSDMAYVPCRKTQAVFDKCVLDILGLERPHYGYHCLPKIHETDRPQPLEQKPAWMDNDKAKKLQGLPKDFPRDYKSWGTFHPNSGEI